MSAATRTPQVSVIIAAYNGSRYIVQAVESVLCQTFTDLEIIVVDDGSTDETHQVLQPYFDRIRYVYQENAGVAAARNRGIQESKGEFIAFLDQDDFFLPDKLAAQISLFRQQLSLGIVNSGWRIVNQQGDKISDIKAWEYFPKLNLETWIVQMPVLPSAMMFSRQWLELAGGFNSEFDSVDDSDLVLRLALLGCEAAWLPQVTVSYRQHDQNVSIKKALKQANLFITLKQQFFAKPDLPQHIRELENPAFYEALTWMAWQLYYSNYPVEAVEFFQKSIQYSPYPLRPTVTDWQKRLSAIAQTYGVTIDFQSLRNLPEWKKIMASIPTSKTPRVSVIIPAYNCEHYITRAVESAVNQTYQNWEIIVVDDGSTDNTRQTLEPYRDVIQYVYQENQGAAKARNRACEMAKGEFLAFLDADDFFLPEKLAKQIACFEADPTLGMVQNGWLMVDETGKDIYPVMPWEDTPNLDLESFVLHKSVRPSAMMVRREWWERLGGFDHRFPPTEDLDFALRLGLKGCKCAWLKEILTCYRQHDSNLMSGGEKVMKSMEIVMEQFFAQPNLPDRIRQLQKAERYKSLVWIAWRMYRDGYLPEMVECLRKSLYYTPYNGTETVFKWLETFRVSSEKYTNNFDAYALTNLKEWQDMVAEAVNNTYQFKSEPSSIGRQLAPHVLVYAEDHGIGGLAQFNHSLLSKLAADGYRVTSVQTKASNPLITEQQQLGIEHIWLEFDTMREFLRIAYNCSDAERIYAEAKPDLIIFSDGWPMANFAAKQVALKQNIPYVITLGYIDRTYKTFNRGDQVPYFDAVAYQYNLAKAVIAVSHENLNLFKSLFKMPREWGKVIYYGRPNNYFEPPNLSTRQRLRQEQGIPEEAVVCFTAARLTPIKGYQYQLQAIAKLKNLPVWPQIYFVWAGPGSTTHDNMEPELRATVNELGVTEQVKFIGQRWDIADWLDASDIFILSSKAEGMPLAVMEAMAKGLPVIATAVSGIPEELGDTGKLIADPTIDAQQTAQELAATVELWAQNPELRRLAGQACKLRAQELFKEERMLLEYSEVVAQVLSASGNRDEFALAKPSKRIAPKVQKQIEKVDSMLHYYYLVWQAWQAWERGDMSGMVEKLQSAWKCTPLLTSETILSWIVNFVALSSEKGEQFDTCALINSEAWQELMELVQGFELALSR
ncbi:MULTISPECIES: glycosyltransferase [unclassified Microcoleus]|uniref:glycosyltransferase n=1 Tax=unclassified Microcoleus TaxID=2642155 RepID=UPI001DB8F5E6|nr:MULTISPECIES: glycosyltransferase [unclassified Microcoleus]MCC3428674.1 glycosyltransferase [Microcoleus sp. PH2017_04_SCI_O_A]MCC3443148.1 glycosyltransferase [Microcoleus sp. PH2017_03_ELD_O_A]MCC3501992.1 glycosyltransferase [Microcoleus sp. PH2017_19_SFW_U_A]TAG99407.1 MAG: glycosyltransferase [Oscillatoriales cyanobacterium]MCC3520247.1 glycosyltransferase [Microcoleus sp. PH2017_20_SFW_D_A]